jgi:hypothetical protein
MFMVHKADNAADARTYQCELCDRTFFEESVLEVHKKLHGVRVVKDKESSVEWPSKRPPPNGAAQLHRDDDEMSEDGVPLEVAVDLPILLTMICLLQIDEEEEEDEDDQEEMMAESTSAFVS